MFLIVALVHVILIFFITFNMKVDAQAKPENARLMKLVDLSEIEPEPPPPPPPEEVVLPQVESIAETMVETEVVPEQIVVAPGTVTTPVEPSFDDYLPQHKVAKPPHFNQEELMDSLIYPTFAQRSNKEGIVYLELYIDKDGNIQMIKILREDPEGWGFGDAALKTFTGKHATPASNDKGEPVSSRIRWPVRFKMGK